jgi:hypothetical protein
MSDSIQSDDPGRYVAEYIGGPVDATVEHRYLIEGEPEPRITQMAIVNGGEGMFDYVAGDSRQLNGEMYVRYTFDAGDSDELAGKADPGDYSRHI